ncbi:MAG: prephenate dehydrogenase/arogenate dehydrogenase family protein [Chromatiales bacterium]|nr:prephenate dehydrogenase/arogenate dehydrogenase family protein [Chromatiales bacterium]
MADWRDDRARRRPDRRGHAAQGGGTRSSTELAARRPRGVVFDIGSLKTPLRAGLAALRDAGVRVTSVHPMFGPDTELLSGRHVIFIDLGDAAALEEARGLFASTMAELVVMGPRRARPPDRVRARAVARAQHRVLHRARRERRGRAAARAHVEHDLRRPARRRDAGGRPRTPTCTTRSRA